MNHLVKGVNYTLVNHTKDESGETLDHFSCHGHKLEFNTTPTLILLIPLFLGSFAANIILLYVLRKYRDVIDKVIRHYCASFAVVDLVRTFFVILPSIARLLGAHSLQSASFCFAGYWINLFGTQSSMLLLTTAAYDRVMVLRKSEKFNYDRPRWKNTFLFGILIPLSYMSFDILYTKLYVSNKTGQYHELMCYDGKLGWCMTKGAPHEHAAGVPTDLSGSKKSGVFICQAHIMTVLILIALLSLQSGHANYKKMFDDNSHEGDYYLMVLAINVWLYLPTMFAILMDTFTSSVFPEAYYERFYIYLYIVQLLPCVLNSCPVFIAYRDYIINGAAPPAKQARYQHIRGAGEHGGTVGVDTPIDMDRLYRRLSRLDVNTDFSQFGVITSPLHSIQASLRSPQSPVPSLSLTSSGTERTLSSGNATSPGDDRTTNNLRPGTRSEMTIPVHEVAESHADCVIHANDVLSRDQAPDQPDSKSDITRDDA